MTDSDAFPSGGRSLVQMPGAQMELIVDMPAQPATGIAVVTHPQPLLGGSAEHKVPTLLARALREAGWLAVRPNFRGVGASSGEHDRGIGETEDVLALVTALRAARGGLPVALLGFSFGAFVQCRVARALADAGLPASHLVLAGLPSGLAGGRHYETPPAPAGALIVHGERDDVVPLSAVLDWARPQSLPVVVVPGADHFFGGRLPLLRALALAHLKSSG